VTTVSLTPALSVSLRDTTWNRLRTSLPEELFRLLSHVTLSKLLCVLFSLDSKEEVDSLLSESPLSKEIGDDGSQSFPSHFLFFLL
jgi:hypothetical protein